GVAGKEAVAAFQPVRGSVGPGVAPAISPVPVGPADALVVGLAGVDRRGEPGAVVHAQVGGVRAWDRADGVAGTEEELDLAPGYRPTLIQRAGGDVTLPVQVVLFQVGQNAGQPTPGTRLGT